MKTTIGCSSCLNTHTLDLGIVVQMSTQTSDMRALSIRMMKRLITRNNTIGSREEAQRNLSLMADSYRSAIENQTERVVNIPEVGLRRRNLDSLSRSSLEGSHDANNRYTRAAGSNELVQIPARRPTVDPPPVMYRIPGREYQTVAQAARYRDMVRRYEEGQLRQEPSSESLESTDSGEYTIRDGSSLSPPGSVERAPQPAAEISTQSLSPAVAASVLTATLAASLPPAAEGYPVVMRWNNVFPQQPENIPGFWELLFLCVVAGFTLGICAGWFMFGVRVRVMVSDERMIANPENVQKEKPNELNSSRSQSARHRHRPRRHQGPAVYMTPGGECIHMQRACPCLRLSRKVETRHICTVCTPMASDPP